MDAFRYPNAAPLTGEEILELWQKKAPKKISLTALQAFIGGIAAAENVYDFVPPETTNGTRIDFTVTGGFAAGSVRVRLNGLALDPGIDFVELGTTIKIMMPYPPAATEKIHVDYKKL